MPRPPGYNSHWRWCRTNGLEIVGAEQLPLMCPQHLPKSETLGFRLKPQNSPATRIYPTDASISSQRHHGRGVCCDIIIITITTTTTTSSQSVSPM
jgi:hypothetical protein